jgi:hypothetical protein
METLNPLCDKTSKTSVHRDSNFYHITAKYQKENKQFTPQLLQIFHNDL